MRTWADAFVCVAGALLAPVGFVDEVLADYRIHGSNVSGSNEMSLERSCQALDGYRRLTTAVNDWATSIGDQGLNIQVERNLGYIESNLMFNLLNPGSSRSQALHVFLRYVRLLARDDQYSPPRKLLSVAFTAVALLIPRGYRARWLTIGLSHSASKEKLRRFAAKIRAQIGRSD
jgi:hypothetical protein